MLSYQTLQGKRRRNKSLEDEMQRHSYDRRHSGTRNFTHTHTVVRVRDWRLGMLYYASSIAVAIYITWSIVDGQLWMQQESPSSGSIRVSLREPRDLTATTDLSYCTAGKRGFMAGVQCAFIPGQVVAPSVEEGATFITTRVSISSFARNPNCAATDLMQVLPTTSGECLCDRLVIHLMRNSYYCVLSAYRAHFQQLPTVRSNLARKQHTSSPTLNATRSCSHTPFKA